MTLLPADADRVANHHIQHQVVSDADLRVGIDEGNQGDQGLDAEAAVFGRLNLAEQVLDVNREVALAGGLLLEQRCALEPVAALELVADDQAAAVVQQAPDSGVEVPGHVLQRSHALPVFQPVFALFELLQGFWSLPAHPATEVQLLLALQGGLGVLHIAEHLLEPPSDGVGRRVAEGLEGFTR